MGRYAQDTTVPADRSRAEIERTLERYGATAFLYGRQDGTALVGFKMAGRLVQFRLELPDRESAEFTHTPGRGFERAPGRVYVAWEKATRQRWRALALVVKAKLEAVESGVTTFDDEFLAHIVLPDGRRMGEWAVPQIEQAYETGRMPPLLPCIPGKVPGERSRERQRADSET